jgi:exodeoxyribonuclease-3
MLLDHDMSQVPNSSRKCITLLSWNINGIRAAKRKGFQEWFLRELPDILCLQETRAQMHQIPHDLFAGAGYYSSWFPAKRPGYGGTAVVSRLKPRAVEFGIGDAALDTEGRALTVHFDTISVLNCYVPNGNAGEGRFARKLAFYDRLVSKCEHMRHLARAFVVCGDFNTAHQELDLALPGPNRKRSGFMPEERRWIDRLIDAGFVDTFRYRYPLAAGRYTWWANTYNARARNVGWRFDYVFMGRDQLARLDSAFTLPEVMFSDHCPVGVTLNP